MTRAMGHYVAPPVLALWVAELALAFFLVCLMTAPVTWSVLLVQWPTGVSMNTVDHAAFLAVTLGATAGAIGLYRPEVCIAPRRVAYHAVIVALLAFLAALLVGAFFHTGEIGGYAIWLAKVLAIWAVVVLASRWLLRAPLSRVLCARKIAVIGSFSSSKGLDSALRSRRGELFELDRVISPDSRLPEPADLRRDGIWAIVASETDAMQEPGRLLEYRLQGVRVLHEAAFWEQMLDRINLGLLTSAWFLEPAGFEWGITSRFLKRSCDIVISIVLLIVGCPVMALAALAVRLDSPGPILYRQERVGLGGRPFTLLKFRSMRQDAEPAGKPMWAAQRDPRITRVGAFIRTTRIDELPQLLNVLRGDMSLVGPRPERPHFVRELSRAIPFYGERSYVKPGITGWAQINYPYGASVEDAREKLSYDLYYVRHRGFLFDLLILSATVRVILFREGAR